MQLRSIVALAVASALAGAGGLWLWTKRPAGPSAQPADVAAAGSLEARVELLRAELAAERDARLGLSAQVEMLRLLLEDGAGASFDVPPAEAAAALAPGSPDEAALAANQQAPEGASAAAVDRSWFDSQGLLESGVSAADVESLESTFEESALQSLYLRDQATREGWLGTPRFVQATIGQRMALRTKLGDESFDQFLYGTHRPNRVKARSVLPSGPAARAGMRNGDLILRYDGKNIFGARELQGGTTLGEAGRTVAIDVMSEDGAVRRLTLPSGPLGVQLAEVRLPPLSTR